MGTTAQTDAQAQAQNLSLRGALSAAYAAVEGAKSVQSFSALTFEDLAQQQIDLISGPDTPTRPNELNQVQSILNNLLQAVTQLQSMPATSFTDPDSTQDVNTPA